MSDVFIDLEITCVESRCSFTQLLVRARRQSALTSDLKRPGIAPFEASQTYFLPISYIAGVSAAEP